MIQACGGGGGGLGGDGRPKYLHILQYRLHAVLLNWAYAILRGHPSQAKVYPFVGQRKYIHFSLIFGQTPEIEPATSRSAVKRSSDWANPTAVTLADMCIGRNISPAIINDHDPKRTKWDRQNLGFFSQFYVGVDLHFSGVVFPLRSVSFPVSSLL